MTDTLASLSIDTSAKPGSQSALVLGIASCGMKVVAVGGQGRDLFLLSDDGDKFRVGHSQNGGLRNAWLTDSSVWVVGEYGYAARSDDGGGTWEKISLGNWKAYRGPCLFGVVQGADGAFWIAGDGGFVMRSADGTTFAKVAGVKESIGRITSTSMGVLIPTDPGHLFVTDGKKIRKLGADAGDSLMVARMTPHGTIVAVGNNGVVIRSTDRGESFVKVKTAAKGLIAGLDVLSDGRVVMCGASGGVFVSSDDGETFEAMEQHVSTAQLWCVKSFGSGALIGGTAGVILRLKNAAAPDVFDAVATPPAAKAKVERTPVVVTKHPLWQSAWAAPPPSTARQAWTPKWLPIEKKNGVFWTPQLRALIHPRRGGIATTIRPLPTLEEAWARFRRTVWADDRVGMDRKKSLSTIWSWVTSFDAGERRRGERLLDIAPRAGTFEDDAALMSATFEKYGQFPAQFHDDAWESLTDFFVASVGLPDALRRAYVAMDDELPYTGTGPFGRFRELLVLADAATYAIAKKAILESHAAESEKSKGSTHREPDLKWLTTLLLPLGPEAGDEERRLHEDAMRHVKKFGDFGVHVCGLAAGDASTLDRFLKANKGVRHEFFAGEPRRHIASILDIDAERAAPMLAKMKLASPFEDSAEENNRWVEIIAHLDHDDALEALYQERKRMISESWGNYGLAIAARFNFDRVMDFAKKKKDGALVEMIERERGKAPDEPSSDVEDPNIAPLATPTEYVPAAATFGVMLANPLGVEPEVVWRETEMENADFDREVNWNGASLQSAKAEEVDAFVAHAEKWARPSYLNVIAATPGRVHSRLFALGFDISQAYWARYVMQPVMVKHGADALPVLVATLQSSETFEAALAPAQGIGDVSLAPTMIEAFAGKKFKTSARSWMLRHPKHAAVGALELFTKDANVDAARALRFLDTRGHRGAIVDFATRMNVKDAVVAMLDQDPLTQPKVKKPVLPKFATPSKLPKLVNASGKAATEDAVEKLLVELAFSNADEIHPGVLAAKRAYTAASRAAFAWTLFEAWLKTKDSKESWCMQAVGFLGDDDSARKLAALAKAWPGEGFGARAQAALDALLNIGTDTALVNINILAEKSKFPAFKAAAGERIMTIADARGLTTDELADRLVPTLGLDEAGASVLDFGSRKFSIGFDERMLPVVKDATGALLGDLPKPTKADNAAKAKEAKAKFSGLKKDAKTTASLQLARMERAMRTGRLIERELFLASFAMHPWMRHLAQRLVWGAHSKDGKAVKTFRVAEDGSLADSKDAEYKLPKDATVSVLHPLRMEKNVIDAWSALFAEYRIIQPFLQLSRPTFAQTDEERSGHEVERFRGRKVTYGALRGLEGRGWQKWMDDAVTFVKPIANREYAHLDTDPGWHPSQTADDIEPQTIGAIHLPEDLVIDPVVFSEIVLDIDSLTHE